MAYQSHKLTVVSAAAQATQIPTIVRLRITGPTARSLLPTSKFTASNASSTTATSTFPATLPVSGNVVTHVEDSPGAFKIVGHLTIHGLIGRAQPNDAPRLARSAIHAGDIRENGFAPLASIFPRVSSGSRVDRAGRRRDAPRVGKDSKTHATLVPHLPVLGRLLSGTALRELHRTRKSSYLAEAFRASGLLDIVGDSTSLLDVSKFIFDCLKSRYRSDYVYRSAIANKIFLGRHSPSSTALLSEFRVWRSRVDLLMMNGTSTAYEIKSGLDSARRLGTQIDAYARMFDRVYVVTEDKLLSDVTAEVPDFVGIITLTSRFTLRTERECQSNAYRVDIATIADALRAKELRELTYRVCGAVPETTNARMFDACKSMLLGAEPQLVHDSMVPILKKRTSYSMSDFTDVAQELVPAYMATDVEPRKWPEITELLTSISVGEIARGGT